MTPTSREEKGHQTQFPTQPCRTHTQSEAHPAPVPLPDEGVMHDRCHWFLRPQKKAKNTQRLSEDTIKSNQSQKKKKKEERKQCSLCALRPQIEEFLIVFQSGTRKTIQIHEVLFSFIIIYYYCYYYYLLYMTLIKKKNVDNKILLRIKLKCVQYMVYEEGGGGELLPSNHTVNFIVHEKQIQSSSTFPSRDNGLVVV